MSPIGSISGTPAENRDGVARLHGDVALPAGAVKHHRRIAFELPVGDVALVVLHVQEEVAVGIGPLDFGEDAGQSDGLIRVVFGTKRMVGKQRGDTQTKRASHQPRSTNRRSHSSPRTSSLQEWRRAVKRFYLRERMASLRLC